MVNTAPSRASTPFASKFPAGGPICAADGHSAQELDLNGYSFGTPASCVIQVPLQAGANQIEFSNPGNYALNLDSITISPPMVF